MLTDIVGSSRPMTVSAPDDSTRAVARFTEGKEDGTLTVYLGVRGGFEFPGGPGAELLWAPDSRALAVTYADSDERMRTAFLVHRKTHGWRRVNLADAVAKVYRVPEGCDEEVHLVIDLAEGHREGGVVDWHFELVVGEEIAYCFRSLGFGGSGKRRGQVGDLCKSRGKG